MTFEDTSALKPRMTPNSPDKLNTRRTVLISLAFLSVLVVLTYYNLAVPILLENLIPEGFSTLGGLVKEKTFIGILMTI